MRTLNPGWTFALSALGFACAAIPAQAETINCTPITSVPYVITVQGVYCFTGNLATAITAGNAIDVQTNNVTIDLNGFKLGGLAAGSATNAYGIYAFQRQNITIRNGIVRGFKYGIWFDDPSPYTTSLGHLVEDLVADQNILAGIDVRGRGCVVRRNQVVGTGTALLPASYGIYVAGPGNDVLNNRVAGTANTTESRSIVILLGDGSVVEDNRISGDMSGTTAYGIFIDSSLDVFAAGNQITTVDNGIFFNSSTGKYMDNLTSGVTVAFSGGTAVGTNN